MAVDTIEKKRSPLGPRFEEALAFAVRLHAGQRRKGTEIPYAAHLLSVSALVIEDGGGEDEAIAALLHDAVEDQGGRATLEKIRERFGEKVATIVHACSDADTIPKPPWRERKERHIEKLRSAPPEVLRVAAADKLHNARSILEDLRVNGDAVWSRFRGGRDGTLWYYQTMTRTLHQAGCRTRLMQELDRVVGEIESLAAREI